MGVFCFGCNDGISLPVELNLKVSINETGKALLQIIFGFLVAGLDSISDPLESDPLHSIDALTMEICLHQGE